MNIKKTPLLDSIDSPDDLKKLSDADLKKVADELRQETINSVSKTGGHLGAGLGVIELTVALHSIFDAPHDKIIWDVGHQSYPHKILTGRRNKMNTLRKKMVFLVLLNGTKVYLMLLAQVIVQPLFHLDWACLLLEI